MTSDGGPGAITPTPTEEEAAAIAAAVSLAFDRPAPTDGRETVSRWRWSGRWWSKPAVVRRDRPW